MSSIQFGCQGCGQRLKVPEGSEGKQVRCPECETVNVIPTSSETAPSEFAAPPAAPTQTQQEENPFAAPSTPSTGYSHQSFVPPENLTHQAINFGDVLEQSWERYKAKWGICAAFGLIFLGIGFASGFLGQLVQMGAAAAKAPVLTLITTIVVTVLQQVVSAFQQVMSKRFGLNIVRGSDEPLNGIFSFDRVLRVVGFFFLVGIGTVVAIGLCLVPGAISTAVAPDGGPVVAIGVGISVILAVAVGIAFFILMLRFFLAIFFIVDRDATIFEACEQSTHYMNGNKLQAFLTTFVAGLLVSIAGVITCGIGFILLYPLLEIVQAMIYSKATGQYQQFRQRTI